MYDQNALQMRLICSYGSAMGNRLAIASPVSFLYCMLLTESSLSDQVSMSRPNSSAPYMRL